MSFICSGCWLTCLASCYKQSHLKELIKLYTIELKELDFYWKQMDTRNAKISKLKLAKMD